MPLTSEQYSLLQKARDTLLAAQSAIPSAEEVETLHTELGIALERGYFTPEEDARIKSIFSEYLHIRGSLHQTLQSLRLLLPRFGRALKPETQQGFVAAWFAGCILMRSARFMVHKYHSIPQIRKLLNQADPVYGIPPGLFDLIHQNSTHPATLIRYMRALRFAEQQQSALSRFGSNELTGPLLKALESEQPYIETQKRAHAAAYTKCQLYRIRSKPSRRYHAVMWGLFEASGRAIAEMRNPFHRKRVRKNIKNLLADLMQPGDILITRHDDAMSNLFLPGFWPHAAFVIGTPEQREALGVRTNEDQHSRSQNPVCILEAKKDGVRFRSLDETLAVDALVLLRPRFAHTDDQRCSVERALAHEGKLYDFEFDFTRTDRLVCTELVYRSLDGLGELQFELIRKAGRFTLPAEELMKQGLKKHQLDVVLSYGLRGNQLVQGNRAKTLTERSVGL